VEFDFSQNKRRGAYRSGLKRFAKERLTHESKLKMLTKRRSFMSKKQNREPDDPEQSKRFIETAREMGADETRAGADRAFKKAVLPKQQARKQT